MQPWRCTALARSLAHPISIWTSTLLQKIGRPLIICTYVFICIYIYISVYEHVFVCVCVQICVYTFIYIGRRMYMHSYSDLCTWPCCRLCRSSARSVARASTARTGCRNEAFAFACQRVDQVAFMCVPIARSFALTPPRCWPFFPLQPFWDDYYHDSGCDCCYFRRP